MRTLLILCALWPLAALSFTPAERAAQLRQKIRASGVEKSLDAEKIKLPTSRGFAQGATSLCWSYAFLNALETMERVKNPNSKLELSRAFMQYHSLEDRVQRHVRREHSFLSERGTPLDALMLARKHGLMAFEDMRDIVSDEMAPTYRRVANVVAAGDSAAEQEILLQTELEQLFGILPQQTQRDGVVVPLLDLSRAVIGDTEWISYAPGPQEAYGPHADTDARPEMRSFFTSMDAIKQHVYRSLKAGRPVAYAANGHVVLIYGGVFDRKGSAQRFYIKDTYEPFFYTADASKVFEELLEVTMVKP